MQLEKPKMILHNPTQPITCPSNGSDLFVGLRASAGDTGAGGSGRGDR